jgi:hypothetical protein
LHRGILLGAHDADVVDQRQAIGGDGAAQEDTHREWAACYCGEATRSAAL